MACAYVLPSASACRAQTTPCLALARYNLSKTAKDELLRLVMKKKEASLNISSPDEAKRLVMNLELEWSQPRCRFYMREFKSFRKSNLEWKSEPFYCVPSWGPNQNAGYKLQLGVYANGYGEASGTGISVFVYLLQGEYDSQLQWPVDVDTTVQLLDQRQVKQPTHIKNTISLKSSKVPFEESGSSSTGLELPQSVVQTPAIGALSDSLGCTPHARSARIMEKSKRKKI